MDEKKIKNLIQREIDSYMMQKQYTASKIPNHTHNGTDSSFVAVVDLPSGTPIKLGLGALVATSNSALFSPSSASEQIQTIIVSGKDMLGPALGTTTDNLQLNLLHQPQNTSNQSFITASRPPFFTSPTNSTISVTLGGSTVTINNYSFENNSLAGALIDIYNSSGTLIETQTIASNTSSVITITGTWLATTTGGTFTIFQPVFFGSADTIFQRFYTQEGTGGGIRFGVGVTNGGQNGLLYSDATGDLYWRNKAGVSVKLN